MQQITAMQSVFESRGEGYTWLVRPKTSRYEGALSMDWVPTWTLTPTITMDALLLKTSMEKPPAWREEKKLITNKNKMVKIPGSQRLICHHFNCQSLQCLEKTLQQEGLPSYLPRTSHLCWGDVWSAERCTPGGGHCRRTRLLSAPGTTQRNPRGRTPVPLVDLVKHKCSEPELCLCDSRLLEKVLLSQLVDTNLSTLICWHSLVDTDLLTLTCQHWLVDTNLLTLTCQH